MTRLLSLLFLSVLLVASTSTATAINQNDVLKAVSNQPDPETQIEPSTGETDTEVGGDFVGHSSEAGSGSLEGGICLINHKILRGFVLQVKCSVRKLQKEYLC